jgi:hypothetical protein
VIERQKRFTGRVAPDTDEAPGGKSKRAAARRTSSALLQGSTIR